MEFDPWRSEEMVSRIVLGGMREGGGDPIVFQYLVHVLLQQGEDRADRCLEEISGEYILFEAPLVLGSKIWPRAAGVELASPGAAEIHLGFAPALRELADFFSRQKPPSPGRAEPVVARADELGFSSRLTATQLRIVGHLLAVEGIGEVEWDDRPVSTWSCELGPRILDYRRVATFGDFVRLKSEIPD